VLSVAVRKGVMSLSRIFVVVDDDDAVRESTMRLLLRAGHRVHGFSRGGDFIQHEALTEADAILLDLRMPGMSGIDVLRSLRKRVAVPPVVVLTGHGDIPLAVEAIKLGATEFLEKPYPPDTLLEILDRTAERGGIEQSEATERRKAVDCVARLTARQREVLAGIARGEPNKIIAYKLGLSTRTVEAYRAQLIAKLRARTTAEAVRLAVLAGVTSDHGQ
jgi:two-component system response regulator FixJ